MSEDQARRLAEERSRAREAKDFALADELRERIGRLGFDVADTPSGPALRPKEQAGDPIRRRSTDVPSLIGRPPTADVSVHWLAEGWPEDIERGIESFRRHQGGLRAQHVVVDAAGLDRRWPAGAECVRVDPRMGWGAARNAGLRRSEGEVIIVADGSVVATGDVLTPLVTALRDATVGLTGPFGITTGDLRQFHQAAGPDVDAVEGYLMAFRRDLLAREVLFDERFTFYRTCDVEFSFRVKALGLRATVTSVPVMRHQHRMWATTSQSERDRLSKRNFYRFLDRWRGRTDLLVDPDR